jgi:hypothetical protein
MDVAILLISRPVEVGANAFVAFDNVVGVLNVARVSRAISKAFFH